MTSISPDRGRGSEPVGAGLAAVDHLTHNVFPGAWMPGRISTSKLFNFREIRYFDIEGKLTGLCSRAMTSPCGKIRIPLNESADDKSQIEEYLQDYHGEGIQHIALSTDDIYRHRREAALPRGISFLDSARHLLRDDRQARCPATARTSARLRKDRILIDGAPESSRAPRWRAAAADLHRRR